MSDDQDFTNLFGTDDEASDIDDGRSQSSSPLPSHQHQQQQQQQPQQPQTSHYDHDDDDDDSDAGSDAIMFKRQKNTVDDLFGSEDEDEDEMTKPQQRANRSNRNISDDDEQIRDDQELDGGNSHLYGEEEVGDDDYDAARQQQRVEVALNMPALPIPDSKDGKYYLAKLPRFLDIDMQPFEPESLQLEVEEGLNEADQLESIRQQVESTIRWRQVDDHGDVKIQSNAHFVDWEDGSRSLMIGQECFDVVTKSMGGQEYTFLLAHQTSSGVLESHTQFTDHMTFQPSDIQSLTHRHLTAHIAGKHVKKTRTKMFFTEMDPEKQKQELEAQENERLRAAKKLESQRRRADMQFDDSGRRQMEYDYGDEEDDEGAGRQPGGGGGGGVNDIHGGGRAGGYAARGDVYDDDFVVDDEEYDEEEERERERRLAQVKQSGMDRYKRTYSDEEEEEEDLVDQEEDEEEGEEEDEDVVVRRTKRRHVESDDDDE